MARADDYQQKEYFKCRQSFLYFAEKYLRTVDRDTAKRSPVKPWKTQLRILAETQVATDIFVLKSRQVGGSLITAAYYYWQCFFFDNRRAIVVAHTADSVKKLFRHYRYFHECLPAWLHDIRPTQTVLASGEIVWHHGSIIDVTTSNSEKARGQVYQMYHLSEFAFYEDGDRAVAAILSAAPETATVIRETTANGMNHAHRQWYTDSDQSKLFFPWTYHDRYATKRKPRVIPDGMLDYAKQHRLTQEQFNWACMTFVKNCASNWNTFNQEYPITPEVAFISSGSRVFPFSYPHVEKPKTGLIEYDQPRRGHVYTMGVDTASGAPEGDFHAFHVIDYTDWLRPKTVATYYDRTTIRDYAGVVLEQAQKWDALVNAEANSYGASVIEHLVANDWARMYMRRRYNKAQQQYTAEFGWYTSAQTRPILISRLTSALAKSAPPQRDDRIRLLVEDRRLMAEINTFVYNKRGKAEADTGHDDHDDMLVATALALISDDQLTELRQEKEEERPQTLREILEWERRRGMKYHDFKRERAGSEVLLNPLAAP